MTTRIDVKTSSPIIESRDQLIASFAKGEKPKERWRIGTEHEKFVYANADHHAPSYDEPGGIRDLLKGLEAYGWRPVEEGGNVIAMSGPDGSISLEPAGQFELSGAPLDNLHETCAETGRHLEQVKAVGDKLGIGFLGMGMWPDKRRDQLPIMPKGRYAIMLRHMPRVGSLGLDMMLRTCTIQVNLDYASEADMAKKFRVGLALQPLATALFANSPFTDGRLNGDLSERSTIWTDTDNNRAGMLPFAFEDGMGFERYVDYALDVPMYFIKRGDVYIDVAGSSFRDLLDGRHPACPGETATLSDWANHLSTIFPEVRLKTFLEMRGADAGPIPFLTALPAFFTGLLYAPDSLDAAWDLVKHWTAAERLQMRNDAPRLGLATTIAGRTLRDVGRDVLDLSRAGLASRRRRDAHGADESVYLHVLDDVLAGRTQAELLIEKFRGPWGGSVDPSFRECVYDAECEECAERAAE